LGRGAICVGGYCIKIRWAEGLRADLEVEGVREGAKIKGYFDSQDLEIAIDTAYPLQIQRATLYHEIRHAVCRATPIFSYELAKEPYDEEVIVTNFERVMWPVVSDSRNLPVWRFMLGINT